MGSLSELPTFNIFDESDWQLFAGAEEFPGGAMPVTAEGQLSDGTTWTVAIASNGAVLTTQEPGEEPRTWVALHTFFRLDTAKHWFLVQLEDDELAAFERGGFQLA